MKNFKGLLKSLSHWFLLYYIISLAVFNCNAQVKHIEELLDKYTNTIYSKPDSAFYYVNQAVLESEKNNNKFLMARSYYNLGYYHYLQNNVKEISKNINKAFQYSIPSNNFKIQSLCYNLQGLIECDKGNYEKALKRYLLALKIAEKNKLDKNISIVYNNLGSLYQLQNDTIRAIEYYTLNKDNAIKNSLKFELLASYNNIGILLKNKDKSKAIENFNKAQDLAVDLNDKYQEFNLLINLSDIYLGYKDNNHLSKGYSQLVKAETIALQLNDTNLLFYVYYNLGGYFAKTKNNNFSLDNYNKALKMINSSIPKDQVLNLYNSIQNQYKVTGDFKSAYGFKEKYNFLKDSLFSVEKNKSFNEIQTKFEVDKKNLKINLLTKQKQIEINKKRVTMLILSSLLIIGFFVIWVYRNKIKTQKILIQKENEIFEYEKENLRKEQELKRTQGVIEGQDQERNRVAKEIHDGIGGKLAGIKLSLANESEKINNPKINSIVNLLGDVFVELRDISHNLSTNNIKDRKLSILLSNLQEEYESRGEFEVEVFIFPENSVDQLPHEIKHNVYRIIQELLANISRHAKASRVVITLTLHSDVLNVMVDDDGIGFQPNFKQGIGLSNIEERLKVIKGSFYIDSTPNNTSIIIDIPM